MLLRKSVDRIKQFKQYILPNCELAKNRQYFLVTSHGQTASMWLAGVLNRFPNVFCTHGYSYPPVVASLDELTDEEMQRRHASANRFNDIAFIDYMHELINASDKKIVGNVLAFYLGRLLSKTTPLVLKNNKVKVVNVIRHPVIRINSTLKTWESEFKGAVPPFVPLDFEHRAQHIIGFLNGRFNVDFEAKNAKEFVVTLLAMEDIGRDVALAEKVKIPNMRYEDITQNFDSFFKLISYLSSGAIADKKKIEEVFRLERINAHNKGASADPAVQYQGWEEWQKAAYDYVVKDKGLNELYLKYGYKLSF